MPRQNRNGRKRRDIRTVARKGSPAALNRSTDGRSIDRLINELREASADDNRR